MKNFVIQTNKENVNILQNGFYHCVLEASEYRKSECPEILKFFETLEDGPLQRKNSSSKECSNTRKFYVAVTSLCIVVSP